MKKQFPVTIRMTYDEKVAVYTNWSGLCEELSEGWFKTYWVKGKAPKAVSFELFDGPEMIEPLRIASTVQELGLPKKVPDLLAFFGPLTQGNHPVTQITSRGLFSYVYGQTTTRVETRELVEFLKRGESQDLASVKTIKYMA